MAAASSSSTSSSCWKYDVFLSFKGEDTRYTFTDHLNKALRARGIETFMDDHLKRGGLITPALVRAIEESRHSIIVLSENYAYSKWCLDELVKILQTTQNTQKRRAVPIFYHVNPSDVGNQRGSFGKALADHEEKLKADHEKKLKYDMERLQGWRNALTHVGKISGFISSRDKPETQFIEEIISDIAKDLNYVTSSDTKNLVGMDCCITELESILRLESNEVLMIGIWGMGGIGKTTLARVIYERLFHQFEGCCFLEGLRSTSMDNLKVELLSKVLGDKSINMGLTSIKARLHSKRVLIVIDDVDHESLLETLIGEHDWFGPQSRVIITTRDKHLLAVHGVDAIYEVQRLRDDNSIKLFSYYAFKNKPPTRDIMKLSRNIISYAQGLPLALKVLGCCLCDRNEEYWMDKLNQLKEISEREIHKVLQISFDGLEDDEKEIFLDIACFFRGSDKNFVRKILESCGFFAVHRIENLIDKSLITITKDNSLEMHDLLQEMGRQIVYKTSPKEPGRRSRLWEQKDISHILKQRTGAKEVEGIFLNLSYLDGHMNFTTKAFSKMTNLRLLKIYRANIWDTKGKMQCKLRISYDFKFNYDELRYLHWDEYPRKSLPYDFESKNLAHLCISHSHLTKLWKGQKVFGNLKFVDASYSQYLKETPDFSRTINLEVLVLKGCTNLRKIHPSLGYLTKLISLNLEKCVNLEHLPSFLQLASLETLIISGCSELKKLPEVPQHMPYLAELYLDGTAITDFSGWSDISGNLDCSRELNSDDSSNDPTLHLISSDSKLEKSHLCTTTTLNRTISDEKLHRYRHNTPTLSLWSVPRSSYFVSPHCSLTSLTRLNLSGTPIIHLPWNLERLHMLQTLELTNCSRLQELPVLPSSLKRLDANNCLSLELISSQSLFRLHGGFLFGNCFKLRTYQSKMEHDVQSVASHFDPDAWRSTFERYRPYLYIPFNIVFPGGEIPNWFRHHSQGNEINIEVLSDWHSTNCNFLGFALSAVVAPSSTRRTAIGWVKCDVYTHLLNSNSHFLRSFVGEWPNKIQCIIALHHLWLAYVPSFISMDGEKWSRLRFSFSSSSFVKSCGVCPVYIKGTSDDRRGSVFSEMHPAKRSRVSD